MPVSLARCRETRCKSRYCDAANLLLQSRIEEQGSCLFRTFLQLPLLWRRRMPGDTARKTTAHVMVSASWKTDISNRYQRVHFRLHGECEGWSPAVQQEGGVHSDTFGCEVGRTTTAQESQRGSELHIQSIALSKL